MKSNKKAFSMVELLVVISIIAVLAGMIFAVMRPAMTSTKDTASLTLIKSLYTAIEAYKNEVGYYPEPQSDYFMSNKPGGDNQILKDSNFRKYFTFTDQELDNDKLVDSYGTPLIYMYKDDVTNRYFVDAAISTADSTVIYTSNDTDRHVMDLPSDMTHEMFIFSLGSDSKDDEDKEADDANDIYAPSTN